ncbi:MAG: hypothetical protein D6B26_06285 [Spirochaetaceae bacterium]|nr:MAG: hypothetical protein D6B26_06285 [Spirochaetaceae bacterium]
MKDRKISGLAGMVFLLVWLFVLTGCGGKKFQPLETSPRQAAEDWVVVVSDYAQMFSQPEIDSRVLSLGRAGEVFEVEDIQIDLVQVNGERGRWFQLDVPEIGLAWVFSSSLRGFSSREQAMRFSADMAAQ